MKLPGCVHFTGKHCNKFCATVVVGACNKRGTVVAAPVPISMRWELVIISCGGDDATAKAPLQAGGLAAPTLTRHHPLLRAGEGREEQHARWRSKEPQEEGEVQAKGGGGTQVFKATAAAAPNATQKRVERKPQAAASRAAMVSRKHQMKFTHIVAKLRCSHCSASAAGSAGTCSGQPAREPSASPTTLREGALRQAVPGC